MNKKWIKYLIFIVIILAIIIAGTLFFYNKINKKTVGTKEKILDELKYLDSTIIYMINDINNLNNINSVKVQRTGTDTSSGSSSTSGNNTKKSNNQQSGEQTESEESSTASESVSGGTGDSGSSNNEIKNMQKYTIQNNPIILRDKENINWTNLENQAENLYSAWMTITVDLANENVSNDSILAYNENLDNLLTSIKQQDKNNSAICLANLYSLIPKYMEDTSNDEENINIEKIKSNVVSAYSIVGSEKWDDINKILAQAEINLTNLINSSSSSKETKQIKINKCYVLLKELIKSSNDKNADIFYLKYVNLINELEKI